MPCQQSLYYIVPTKQLALCVPTSFEGGALRATTYFIFTGTITGSIFGS